MTVTRAGQVARIWGLAFALATVAALYFGFESWLVDVQATGRVVAPSLGTRASVITWYAWAALAPLLVMFFRAYPVERRWNLRTAAIYVAASFVAVLAHGAIQQPLWLWATHAPPPVKYGEAMRMLWWTIITAPTTAIQFLAFATVYHAIALARLAHARELATSRAHTALAEAELRALKARLEPHFLFNTLNAIVSYVRHDPPVAEEMIGRLSRLLRGVLQSSVDVEIPLTQELALVREYLELHRVRFGQRLTIDIVVEHDLGSALVPSMLLQPLVENAIQHGVAVRPGAGTVSIRASKRADGLVVEVADASIDASTSASYSVPGAPERNGIGLTVTRARLEQLYGDAQRLTLTSTPPGTTVRIDLPLRYAGATT